jgi:hypothetical protein
MNSLRKKFARQLRNNKKFYFYYESDSGKYWRKPEPYLLGIKNNGKGNTYVTGYVYPLKK